MKQPDRELAINKLALAMMETRPDLEQYSLDEWITEHREKLTGQEYDTALAIVRLYEAG